MKFMDMRGLLTLNPVCFLVFLCTVPGQVKAIFLKFCPCSSKAHRVPLGLRGLKQELCLTATDIWFHEITSTWSLKKIQVMCDRSAGKSKIPRIMVQLIKLFYLTNLNVCIF